MLIKKISRKGAKTLRKTSEVLYGKKLKLLSVADFSLRAKFFVFKITTAPFEMTLPVFSVFSVQSVAKKISRKGAKTLRKFFAVLIKLCGSLWQKIFNPFLFCNQ
jgi:hypothetical protein